MNTTPSLFPLHKDGGSLPAPSVKTDGASVPSSVASPQPDGKDAGLGEANSTALSASAGVKKSSKGRKGPRRPRIEITMTSEQLDRAEKLAEGCVLSVPELIRNLLDAFGEKLARRAEAHAQAAGRVTHPPLPNEGEVHQAAEGSEHLQ